MGPPSGTLGVELFLSLRGVVRLRCFFGFTLSELPAFGFQEVFEVLLPVFGFPVVAAKLPFDEDFLASFGQRSKVLCRLSPDGHVYERSDLLAVTSVVVEVLVVSDSGARNRSPRVGFSQGWVGDQITTDDDVIDVHINRRCFSS